jgi:hypothetical protein
MPLEYADTSFFGRRSYEIAGDTLIAKGSDVGRSKFEVKLELRVLDPNFDRLWLRSPIFFSMCFVALLGIVGAAVLGEFSPKPGISWAYGLCLTLGFTGILFSLLSGRRVPVARFKNTAAVAVLDIFHAGPRKKEFEAFLVDLQARIREVQKANCGGSGDCPQIEGGG